MLIQETKDGQGNSYELHAEVQKCDHPPGQYNVTFYTYYSGSKNPNERQIKSQFILDKDAMKKLSDLLYVKNLQPNVQSKPDSKIKSLLDQIKT
jgi:hypothetical protein